MIVTVSRHIVLSSSQTQTPKGVEEVGFFNPLDGDEPEAQKGEICSRSQSQSISEVGLAEPLG